MERAVHRVVNLIEDGAQNILNMSVDAARARLVDTCPEALLAVNGSFALAARDGETVLMARSLDRPMRYFLAKEARGPMLVIAERIDEIKQVLDTHGYLHQFHPAYTRMVPAHHVTALRLIGCPDPNPRHRRFFAPPRATMPADLDAIGHAYIEALHGEIAQWLAHQDEDEPLGVLFSGGVDSGAVLMSLYHALLESGRSPSRLKAFTLAVDGRGLDVEQARAFLRRLDLEMLLEVVDVASDDLDPFEAVKIIEDYKPLDVECATVGLALLRGIRRRYPAWRLLLDGDGGDENLKDYPLEDHQELTIRSVVSNSMLYQEGWGVDAIKHSLTYSGGFSRACVRTYAPARLLGFAGLSPFSRPAIIGVAEAAPFDELTGGSTAKLYALKGQVVQRGMRSHLGVDFPVFEKRRFQHGAVDAAVFRGRFEHHPESYRAHFLSLHGGVPQ
ncbi:MAG: asparagine synthase [Acidobacteria bacterium]|jgi:asparagine synthase (glutamine-hydrolysing)|nr:asparagine synthase [Acidobacteriota bacterium]MDP7340026.1 asparagine synthase-related protein [Vicinamibacterales bacterium]MDP7478152.1 asparagine synthase-related protein [Vicinamibacterales bacterium]HJN46563.1 asparagine synthase-related protein [Vicinamibacterales bacterium]|tara:strand:- start:376 stop:1710 length:1335 start_codon:yes stop_codon:yes gene_type:complete